ncbi:hypothetical protein [Sinisalibacter lacisalsi]|uniref:Uncharacterized protein n=1 Tax=Sinisalibacter lacisalsi TaxID=1526570 RepID=A0ABQ1QS63_9RHOB|nr:hypothetical protein [Sinisalibacter lacisalsi]GGD41097.1 hypothetical protein GCM10011358_26180 [Sinisalibacter lacisalsi]
MAETKTTAAKAAAKEKTKTPLTPEQKAERAARRKAAKVIGFTTFRQEWRAANPEGTKEQRKAAWDAARKDAVRKASRLVRSLEKGGVKLVQAEEPAKA